MKNKLARAAFFALAIVMTAAGCVGSTLCAEECVLDEPLVTADPAKAGTKTIAIGEKTYSCTYKTSGAGSLPGVRDTYITDEGGELTVDSETGRICSFADISPFERIEGPTELTDDELIEAVKERIAPIANTERYNEITVERDCGNGTDRTDIIVEFHRTVEGIETLDRVIVRLYIFGDIIRFSGADDRFAELELPRVSEAQRDKLVREVVEKKLEGAEPGEIKITHSYLSFYKGRSALICYACFSDGEGTFDVATVAIFRK